MSELWPVGLLLFLYDALRYFPDKMESKRELFLDELERILERKGLTKTLKVGCYSLKR